MKYYKKDVLDKAPKSTCYCNHVGDGNKSDHEGIIGHGKCKKCECVKFTWKRFLTNKEQADWITESMSRGDYA